MRWLGARWAAAAAILAQVYAQVTITGTADAATSSGRGGDYPTGSRATYDLSTGTRSLNTAYSYSSGRSSQTSSSARSSRSSSNGTVTSGSTSPSETGTLLVGSAATTTTLNGTASRNSTATSTAARATNTVPCNGHPEYCDRKYSNVTMVGAHNSPFVRQNNVASNQALDVTTQLDDGIRMLQFQFHQPNSTSPILLCHTSCDLLNVGTLESYLSQVKTWLDTHRYDVVTVLMGNYDFIDVTNLAAPVSNSGLLEYAFVPDTAPMGLDGWPTLGEMILTNKRVVFMVDYMADQDALPWLLEEWSYMWETPFSPTDRGFPCTQDRPDGQSQNVSEQRLYMANHNLNIEISFASIDLLVPATNLLNETNADSGYGSAGRAVANCTTMWDRPPNFLLVDYYNFGNFNGSTLAVAAAANNVTFDKDSCCGTLRMSSAPRVDCSLGMMVLAALLTMWTAL